MPQEIKVTTTEVAPPTNKVITLSDRALGIAVSQLGNAEDPHGSNWGKHVQKYLAAVNINFAAPWCMAFVYWCVNEAAKEMGIVNPLIKTGGVMAQWNKIPKEFKVVGPPRKGDIFILDYGKGLGHTGFVTSIIADRILTIEGNSNDEGSREGYEVCRKPGGRSIAKVKGFIRIA